MSLLEIKQISASYAGETFLHQVDFSLKKGEILALLGPSGSGKTSLLRLLAGLDQPDQGQILFAGRDMAAVPSHKRNFGMMFQEYALFPHRNVADNIAFGLEMHRWDNARKLQRINEMLTMVGLEGYADRRIDALSGGERQRVALARSLAPEPQLLLLDEPLGSLDRMLRERLSLQIRAILKSLDVTTVFVTHDQAEAFTVADTIGVLQQGRLEQFADPETVYRQPATVAVGRFLGFRNFLFDSPDSGASTGAGGIFSRCPRSLQLKLEQNQDRAILIRPEGASLSRAGADDPLQIKGRVKRRLFMGAAYQVVVEIAGQHRQTLIFDLPIEPPPPLVGETIFLALAPTAIVFLKKQKILEKQDMV